MSRTDWTSPSDPTVKACLTVPCQVCEAKPGEPCVSITSTPLTRVTHHYRINRLIKGGQNPGENE